MFSFLITSILYLMQPQEVCLFVSLSVCPQLVIFHFPDLIPEKRQYPSVFARKLRFSSSREAIEIPSARDFK